MRFAIDFRSPCFFHRIAANDRVNAKQPERARVGENGQTLPMAQIAGSLNQAGV
jgi:hypothetical protein